MHDRCLLFWGENLMVFPDGAALPMSEITTRGVKAFLIDHYQVPSDDPTVLHILDRCA